MMSKAGVLIVQQRQMSFKTNLKEASKNYISVK